MYGERRSEEMKQDEKIKHREGAELTKSLLLFQLMLVVVQSNEVKTPMPCLQPSRKIHLKEFQVVLIR